MKTSQTPSQEAIRQRAEKIWNAEGRPFGKDVVIWLQAEQQLLSQESPANARPKAKNARLPEDPPKSLEEEADPIANNALEDRLSRIGAPGSRGATSL